MEHCIWYGLPSKIDPHDLLRQTGLYARILIDVDWSKELLEKVLVQRKRDGYDFFVGVTYERILQFCNLCCTIGHNASNYRNINNVKMSECITRKLDKILENRKTKGLRKMQQAKYKLRVMQLKLLLIGRSHRDKETHRVCTMLGRTILLGRVT